MLGFLERNTQSTININYNGDGESTLKLVTFNNGVYNESCSGIGAWNPCFNYEAVPKFFKIYFNFKDGIHEVYKFQK